MIRWTQTLLRSPRNGLRRPSFARHFALSSSSSPSAGAEKEPTSSPAQTPDLQQLEETLVYEGPLGGKLQRIRRISISSTILTVFGLPVALHLADTGATIVSQFALSGTLMFATVSSTIFLQLITHPYISDIRKITFKKEISDASNNSKNNSSSNSKYRVTKFNVFGNKIASEFALSEIVKSPSMSVAFTNFSANKEQYFIQREVIEATKSDPELAGALERLLGKYKSKEELEKEEEEEEEEEDDDAKNNKKSKK